MPFFSCWAMLWWARIQASWMPGQIHCIWLCVSAGWQQREQAAEGTTSHLWSTAFQGNAPAIDWSTCSLRCRDLHLPQNLAQCAPTLIWSEQPGRRGSAGGEASASARGPPSLRSKNSCGILFCHLLNQIFTYTFVPLYPSPLPKEVDRCWILIQTPEL